MYCIIPGKAVLADETKARKGPIIPFDALKNAMKGFIRLVARLLSRAYVLRGLNKGHDYYLMRINFKFNS